MKLTRISCPTHEYDSLRVAAQKIANAPQHINTTKEKTESSPILGKFIVFLPHFGHILLIYLRIKKKKRLSEHVKCRKNKKI